MNTLSPREVGVTEYDTLFMGVNKRPKYIITCYKSINVYQSVGICDYESMDY